MLGVSLLSGVQMTVFPKIFDRLKKEGADDMIVVAGGVMPDEDVVGAQENGREGSDAAGHAAAGDHRQAPRSSSPSGDRADGELVVPRAL